MQPPAGAPEQFANVTLGLGVGLAMLKLTDPDAVPDDLLGVVLSMLVRTLESDPEAREQLAGVGRTAAKKAGKGRPRRPTRVDGASK